MPFRTVTLCCMAVEHVDRDDPEPFYLQLAAILRARIGRGDLSGRLPSWVDLAADFDVGDSTVRHAIAVLRDEGLVVTRGGKGTYVAR